MENPQTNPVVPPDFPANREPIFFGDDAEDAYWDLQTALDEATTDAERAELAPLVEEARIRLLGE